MTPPLLTTAPLPEPTSMKSAPLRMWVPRSLPPIDMAKKVPAPLEMVVLLAVPPEATLYLMPPLVTVLLTRV